MYLNLLNIASTSIVTPVYILYGCKLAKSICMMWMPINTRYTFPHIIILMQRLAHMQVWVCGENSTQVTPQGGRVETLHLSEDGVWA